MMMMVATETAGSTGARGASYYPNTASRSGSSAGVADSSPAFRSSGSELDDVNNLGSSAFEENGAQGGTQTTSQTTMITMISIGSLGGSEEGSGTSSGTSDDSGAQTDKSSSGTEQDAAGQYDSMLSRLMLALLLPLMGLGNLGGQGNQGF
jgi:hypothetical protein